MEWCQMTTSACSNILYLYMNSRLNMQMTAASEKIQGWREAMSAQQQFSRNAPTDTLLCV
ncbi:hypothetical protein NC653_004697 [Populus alba x Populus x berolinensis]|uniref:Uncharacterized protein n=1 Tax=Populus alba x Populus x berolinensis TaxID=444605 RepID=A0AAD6RUW9_9ROSI|nr:hypothetical protein NC653_004697 [Populus alba x Populus x berolinensis]